MGTASMWVYDSCGHERRLARAWRRRVLPQHLRPRKGKPCAQVFWSDRRWCDPVSLVASIPKVRDLGRTQIPKKKSFPEFM
jgi:hypothetical protein